MLKELLDQVLADIGSMGDPIDKEAAARAAGEVCQTAVTRLAAVRSGAVRQVVSEPSMTYRTASVVFGVSHAQTHRLAQRGSAAA